MALSVEETSNAIIHLRGMEFFAYHGVKMEERTLGQRFVVDVDLTLVQGAFFNRDDLALTVDYSHVYVKIADVMMMHTCKTIEYVAESIAQGLLTDFPCLRVRVEVHKPGAPIQGVLGDVSVEIIRSNVWRAYLSLGSNLGDRRAYLEKALDLLGGLGVFKNISHVYETEPLGRKADRHVSEDTASGQWFYNMVVEMETLLSPLVLLKECQRIEALCGRRKLRVGREWFSRTLDIDILMLFRGWGRTMESIQTTDLMVPHPRLEHREFVLAPLREMVPDLVLPSGREVGRVVGEGSVRCLTETFFSAEER